MPGGQGPRGWPAPSCLDHRVEPGGEHMILPAAIDHQIVPGQALPLEAEALEQGGAAQYDGLAYGWPDGGTPSGICTAGLGFALST